MLSGEGTVARRQGTWELIHAVWALILPGPHFPCIGLEQEGAGRNESQDS